MGALESPGPVQDFQTGAENTPLRAPMANAVDFSNLIGPTQTQSTNAFNMLRGSIHQATAPEMQYLAMAQRQTFEADPRRLAGIFGLQPTGNCPENQGDRQAQSRGANANSDMKG